MKIQYTIHDVAALLGISADAIRLYEKEDLVTPKRNPQNSYRYYGFEEIHRIMAISLYRKLGVGIAQIRGFLSEPSFEGVGNRFDNFIEENEKEIVRLQNRTEQLRFMKRHLENLAEGLGTYSIRELPDSYIVFHQDNTFLGYQEIQKIIISPIFSFGNFCYLAEKTEGSRYKSRTLEFIVRAPMIELTDWRDEASHFPVHEACESVYTVKKASECERDLWDLQGMYDFAAERQLVLEGRAYIFYVFSLINENAMEDYYEIYLPICKNERKIS